jgi:hypothetical protein
VAHHGRGDDAACGSRLPGGTARWLTRRRGCRGTRGTSTASGSKPTEGSGFIYDGVTYVPLRFLSEALGKKVEWDDATSTIWMGDRTAADAVVATYQGGQVTKSEFDTLVQYAVIAEKMGGCRFYLRVGRFHHERAVRRRKRPRSSRHGSNRAAAKKRSATGSSKPSSSNPICSSTCCAAALSQPPFKLASPMRHRLSARRWLVLRTIYTVRIRTYVPPSGGVRKKSVSTILTEVQTGSSP